MVQTESLLFSFKLFHFTDNGKCVNLDRNFIKIRKFLLRYRYSFFLNLSNSFWFFFLDYSWKFFNNDNLLHHVPTITIGQISNVRCGINITRNMFSSTWIRFRNCIKCYGKCYQCLKNFKKLMLTSI